MMALLPLLLFIQVFLVSTASAADYAVATEATPVLNRPEVLAVPGWKTTLRDKCGQIRALEFVALPGTVFTITGQQTVAGLTVYRVISDDYPYPSAEGYYVDSRNIRLEATRPTARRPSLPPLENIISKMKSRVGSGYVWGGNVAEGVVNRWGDGSGRLLAGLDCSGLLYEATGGFTPRNTSSLVTYGKAVAISGKTATAIASALRPLDLIVWPGHVLIVIDDGNVIESRLVCDDPAEGVRIRPLGRALEEIMKGRRPVDRIGGTGKEFVVRRWYEPRLVDRLSPDRLSPEP